MEARRTKYLESIKNFGYKIPKDPEKLLYDFYFIVGYLQGDRADDPVLDFVFKEATQTCVNNLQKHMLLALRWSISAEFRNLFEDYASIDAAQLPKELRVFFKKYLDKHLSYSSSIMSKLEPARLPGKKEEDPYFQSRSLGSRTSDDNRRDRAYASSYFALNYAQKALKLSDSQLADLLAEAFTSPAIEWSPSYGGKAWSEIAIAYKKLVEADTLTKKIIYIDHAYDLQHNTGSVFTKVQAYSSSSRGTRWLANALDWKKEQKDLRGFYDKVSSSLKPVVAWVAKNEAKAGTIEDFEKSQKFEPIFGEEVEFKEGRWYYYTGPQNKDWLETYIVDPSESRSILELGRWPLYVEGITRSSDIAIADIAIARRAPDGASAIPLPKTLRIAPALRDYKLFYSSAIKAATPPKLKFEDDDPVGWLVGDRVEFVPDAVVSPQVLEELRSISADLTFTITYSAVDLNSSPGARLVYLRFEGQATGSPERAYYASYFRKVSKHAGLKLIPKPNDEPFKKGHWYKWIGPKLESADAARSLTIASGAHYSWSMMNAILSDWTLKCTQGTPTTRLQDGWVTAAFDGVGEWYWYNLGKMSNPEEPLFAEVVGLDSIGSTEQSFPDAELKLIPKPNDEAFKEGHWYKWIGPKPESAADAAESLEIDSGIHYSRSMVYAILSDRPLKCTKAIAPVTGIRAVAMFEMVDPAFNVGEWNWYRLDDMPNPEEPLFAEVVDPSSIEKSSPDKGVPKPNDEPFKPGHWYKWIGPNMAGKKASSSVTGVYYDDYMTKVFDGAPIRCTAAERPTKGAAIAAFDGEGMWNWYAVGFMPHPEEPLFAEVPPPK